MSSAKLCISKRSVLVKSESKDSCSIWRSFISGSIVVGVEAARARIVSLASSKGFVFCELCDLFIDG